MIQKPRFKKIIFFLLILSPLTSKAQYNWEYGMGSGVSGYFGEMGLNRQDIYWGKKKQEVNLSGAVFVRYRSYRRRLFLKAEESLARISGSDNYSFDYVRNTRNLDFRNTISETTLQLQWVFYRDFDIGNSYRYINAFASYLGLGTGILFNNPKSFYGNEWVSLRPLKTEGKKYRNAVAVIPVSAGFYFTHRHRYRIGLDFTWNATFTDYLDDVSGSYADPANLSSPLAVQLSNRTNETHPIPAEIASGFTPGSQRGDNKKYDSYFTSSVQLSYVVRGHIAFYKTKIPFKSHPDPIHHYHKCLIDW